MTQSSDRLAQIEAILAENARQLVETRQLVESTRQISDSNARAIEAWGSRIEEVQVDTEEATSSTRADLAVRIEDNAHNQGIDRVRFDQLHEEHTQRFNTLLEEARADRAEMRAAREANTTEHRAFTQNIQTLLAEIARLWQRVAG
ncbi:hypothetical protein [Phormidium tenue]|uniref:Uncharacterized protein n=1 Tax=Phormidium tenue NIES-30 TaxID=549789 RepID=A0A1U7IY46_9CYAN|nr:hypothetical protein [Phormidium tenue]MBD2234926.1 hypothetical protein [Phormidium tenue FACHB-1052]OKH43465.1 hypothetical protein NIES30_24965 [Phormidium tenue NIES-30]